MHGPCLLPGTGKYRAKRVGRISVYRAQLISKAAPRALGKYPALGIEGSFSMWDLCLAERKRENQKLFCNMKALSDQVTFLPGFHSQT